MKNIFSLVALMGLMAIMLFTSCEEGKFPGYQKTSDGLYYKFYKKNATATQPQMTDFLKLGMKCYLNDSLYYDFQNMSGDLYSQLSEPKFAGDLQEAYAMLHVGDSASFYVKADSIAILYYDQDPSAVGLASDDYFRYEVKLIDVKTKDAFQAEIDNMKQQTMEAARRELSAYIEHENIQVEPDEHGIYIIPIEKGFGRCPLLGEKVEIDFSASLLNGQEIGSTYGMDETFSFVLGDNYVIPGWEAVVPKLHLGERVKVVIPFEMAYGEHQVGNVPAYSNMVYDIKLLKITTQKELIKQAEEEMKVLKSQSEQAFWDYVKENGISEYTKSGLFYAKSITTEGASVAQGQTARIAFEAYYLDGTPLGNSDQLGGTYDIKYGEHAVLLGLEEAVGLLRVGEKGRFVIPYTLGYGENPYGNIPAYSNLVFDVTLLEIVE